MCFLYLRAKLTEAQAAAGFQCPVSFCLVPLCDCLHGWEVVLTPVCSHSPQGAHTLVVFLVVSEAFLFSILSVSAFLQKDTEKENSCSPTPEPQEQGSACGREQGAFGRHPSHPWQACEDFGPSIHIGMCQWGGDAMSQGHGMAEVGRGLGRPAGPTRCSFRDIQSPGGLLPFYMCAAPLALAEDTHLN